ncbi:MAG TPA: exodeoxyribonuclease VII large subunit [Candidatus Mcinerneyibacterium sp.]|nr:exodeoxyribonuclease VII large subunit [Candidatus Mcinerneyibacterium sp.]
MSSFNFGNNQEKPYSVSELNQIIKDKFQQIFPSSILVKGEITDISKSSTGHVYFTLTDKKSQINCIIWRHKSYLIDKGMEAGKEVLIEGKFNLYVKGGNYSLIVEDIKLYGEGEKYLKKEKLKKELKAKGYFDKSRKKDMPFLPKTIGIVTAKNGAAVKDILKVLKRRNKNVNVILTPSSVQGEKAPSEIANAINLQNEYKKADVIIVGRGGGSSEDLSAFDERIVAEAIYKSQIPIITAVGHEVDYTIADFTADMRAETPSSAAELIIKRKKEISKRIRNNLEKIESNLKRNIDQYRDSLLNYKKSLEKNTPLQIFNELKIQIEDNLAVLHKSIDRKIFNKWQIIERYRKDVNSISLRMFNIQKKQVDELKNKIYFLNPLEKINSLYESLNNIKVNMASKIKYKIERLQKRWQINSIRLDDNSPIKILKKGYSITRKNEQVIKSIKNLNREDLIETILQDGKLLSKIVEIKEDDTFS